MSDSSIKRSRSRDQLCRDLDVSPETLKRQPSLSKQIRGVRDLLKRSDKTAGLPLNPLACLALSQESDAQAILQAARDNHLDYRRAADMEVLCAKMKFPTTRLTEIITKVCIQAGLKASALIAALRHAEVVQHTIESAALPGSEGAQDRMMLHRATGFLPTPKGSRTVVNVTTGAPFEIDGDRKKSAHVPPPEDTIRRLVGRFQKSDTIHKPAALPEETGNDDAVEGEIVEEGEWRN